MKAWVARNDGALRTDAPYPHALVHGFNARLFAGKSLPVEARVRTSAPYNEHGGTFQDAPEQERARRVRNETELTEFRVNLKTLFNSAVRPGSGAWMASFVEAPRYGESDSVTG